MGSRTVGLLILCSFVLTPILGHAFLVEGDHAPEFAVEALDHTMISLSDYSDKIVVLFLFNTSNSRCNDAAPAYEQNVYQVFKDRGVIVFGVDVDPSQDTFEDLAGFRDQHGLTFPLAMDVSGECWGKYKADEPGSLPVFYVIDCLKVIRMIRLGYRPGREEYAITAIGEIKPTLDLSLNRDEGDMTPFLPGETMRLSASLENPAPETRVVVYVAVGVMNEVFFWPSYSKVAQGVSLTLPAGFTIYDYPVEAVTFNSAFPPGIYTWYGVLADEKTGEWLGQPEVLTWPFGQHNRPPEDRASLTIPDEVWSYVRSKVGREGRPLGHRTEDMDRIGGHEFRLNVIHDLFSDITEIPRLSGEIGDTLLENYMAPAEIATYCYSMIDYSQEQELKASTHGPSTLRRKPATSPGFVFDTPEDQANWDALAQEVRDFVTQIVDAAADAGPSVEAAFDKAFLADSLGVSVADLDTVKRSDLYSLVTRPWMYIDANSPAFEAMHRLDFAELSSGTSTFVAGVTGAIDQFRAWMNEHPIVAGFDRIQFTSSAGKVCVSGTGTQRVFDQYSLIVDLGGDDLYRGTHAVPVSFEKPIGAIVELGGNDNYEGGAAPASFCCGLFGVGAIFDLWGDDEYSSGPSGLASAWHGSGILIDYEGDDSYSCESSAAYWCQGAATAGLGLLIDMSGNDTYYTLPGDSQGFGSTLGFGVLLDASGNDSYKAQGLYNEWWGNYTAMAQGAGFGRRADIGSDGRSLAGGIGALVDGDGDDDYWGPIYVQGTGYWWALGILEDRGGNDTYRCVQLSLGGTPHMGLACAVDLSGDDQYNVGNTQQVGQNMGSARDLAYAVFMDGGGNDTYEHRVRSAGAGDIQGMGLFWDRYGNDSYQMVNNPYAAPSDQSYGASCEREPMGNFRDQMCTVGVFLDTDGHDIYGFQDVGGTCGRPLFDENKGWHHNSGPYLWGYGLDIDWYQTPEAP